MNNFQFSIFKADAFGRLPDPWRRGFQKKQGFTLIEALVAVSILTLSVAGPLFTANSAIVAAENARNQMVASSLAQEAIEYVRMMRNNEFLAAYQANSATASIVAWDKFLNNPSSDTSTISQCRAPLGGPAKFCTFDPAQGSVSPIASCPSNVCSTLYLSNCALGTRGLSCTPPNIYTQQNLTGSVNSIFTRTVQAIDISANDERIVSTVSWRYHSTSYSVIIYDHLTPWQ